MIDDIDKMKHSKKLNMLTNKRDMLERERDGIPKRTSRAFVSRVFVVRERERDKETYPEG